MAASEKDLQGNGGDIYQRFESAVATLYQGEYAAAKEELLAILQLFPAELEVLSRVRAWLQVCEKHLSNGNDEVVPDTPEDLYNLAVFHHNNGDYERAISALEESLSRGGDRLHYVHYSLAAAHARLGNRESAVGSLKAAVQLSPEVRHLASQDSDFSALHGLDLFDQLLG